MGGQGVHHITLLDSATAATLAQVLPVLLLTLAVEARRNLLHQRASRLTRGVFFAAFGIVETVLVLSIDGAFYPFQWFDGVSALIIFGLLAIVFQLSLSEPDSIDGF
ncbi:MAG: hypothetical protein U0R66_10430 [Mycobacterium sp.]